jgi:hypothetical protein
MRLDVKSRVARLLARANGHDEAVYLDAEERAWLIRALDHLRSGWVRQDDEAMNERLIDKLGGKL